MRGLSNYKKPVVPRRAEPSGGVQGGPGALVPLSVPERRRLVWRLALALQVTAEPIRAWSRWRRWHQAVAQWFHYKRRGASVPQLQL